MDTSEPPGLLARLERLVMSGYRRVYAYACRITTKLQPYCPRILLPPLRVCRAMFLLSVIIVHNSVVLFIVLTVILVRIALSMIRNVLFLVRKLSLKLLVGLVSFGKKYRYQPLNKTRSEIRLLKIRPAASFRGLSDVGLIRADLITSPIATAPPFAAVSYRWTYSDTVPVLIGGRVFQLSSSICELLKVLEAGDGQARDGQASEPDRYLWIDSICINQDDIAEKSWQVPLMEDIYRSATHVVGWLGTQAPQISEWHGIEGAGDFAAAVGNDFFFRTWIIQEVSLARKLIMYTPHGNCPWEYGVLGEGKTTGDSLSLYGENEFGLSPSVVARAGDGVRNINTLDAFRASLSENPGGLPLAEALMRSTEFKCTDARDRIFGILGLATASARSTITVDYSNGYSEVDATIQAVRFTMTEEATWQLIELSGVGYDSEETRLQRWPGGRPSWVPDWEASHITRTADQTAKAGVDAISEPSNGFGRSPSGHSPSTSLCVEGAVVDRIESLTTDAWRLPDTCDFRDEDSLAKMHGYLDQLDSVLDLARGERGLNDAIVGLLLQKGSRTTQEQPDLQEERTALETLSKRLRERLARGDNAVNASIAKMDLRHFVMGLEQFMPMIAGRRVCRTREGRFAIVPPFSEVGDLLCTFPGAPHSFVLRPRPDLPGGSVESWPKVYQCVGVCYEDEAARCDLRRRTQKLETIEIT